jgi:hypothetical protein
MTTSEKYKSSYLQAAAQLSFQSCCQWAVTHAAFFTAAVSLVAVREPA